MTVSRQQIINRLYAANYYHKDQKRHVELFRQHGTGRRVEVPRRDHIPDRLARVILRQAGLTDWQVNDFMRNCVKN